MTWVCFGFKILVLKKKILYPSVFHTIVGFSFLFGATFTLYFLKVACVHCFCWPRKTKSISFVHPVVGLAMELCADPQVTAENTIVKWLKKMFVLSAVLCL